MTATQARQRTTPEISGSPVLSYHLLIASTGILLTLGLAVVLSSTSSTSVQAGGTPYASFLVQVAALIVGLAALIVGSRLSPTAWKRLAPLVLYSAIGLLIVVAIYGVSIGGNQNWIRIPLGSTSVTFQPSELAKLGLALYLGVVLARFRHELTTWKRIIVPAGAMALVVIGLVMLGSDMGTALVLVMITAAAYWVAGLPLRFFVMTGVGGAIAAAIAILSRPSRMARIETWLNPDLADPASDGYQRIHALWALASGGLWGLGPGESREKWGYLPVADSDFVFAIVGEEFGLVGAVLVLFAFGMMLIAVHRIVHRHQDPWVQISAAALGAWIIGQAVFNIAVVVGLLPITGVPLPLMSAGGSSLIASLAAVGVLMAFARHEPGAQEALSARPSVMSRTFAVLSRSTRG